MARIQVLPLPTQKAGDIEHTPFILILDQANRFEEDWSAEMIEQLRQYTGAATVLAHEATIDAPGALELTDEQREQLLAQLTEPRRWILDQSYANSEPHLIPGPARLFVPPSA